MPTKRRNAANGNVNTGRTDPLTSVNTPRERASGTGEYRQAFCPVCGVAHGSKRIGPPGHSAPVNYWIWLQDRDREQGGQQHVGVIQAVGGGRGRSLQMIGYFGPGDDPDGFFPLVKARLLQAVKRWHELGWIDQADIDRL